MYIVVSNGYDFFVKVIDVNIEDLYIDFYYWFERSIKRKGVLFEYMEFCGYEYVKILKYVLIRWLLLERCVWWIFEKYSGFKLYFLSEEFVD